MAELVGQKDGGHLDDFLEKNGDVFFVARFERKLKTVGKISLSTQEAFFLIFKKPATCSHLPPAATCSHLQPLEQPLEQPLALEQMAASGCKWLLGASGCKWLQVAASGCWGQVAASGCKWLQVAASGCKWLQVAARSLRWKGTGEFATFSGGRHRRIVNILRWKAPENSQHSPVENTGEL